MYTMCVRVLEKLLILLTYLVSLHALMMIATIYIIMHAKENVYARKLKMHSREKETFCFKIKIEI